MTSAPRKKIKDWGRLNAPCEAIFYCSTNKLISIIEIVPDGHISVGDIFHVLICEIKDYMTTEGFIGFGFPMQSVFVAKEKRKTWKEYFEKLKSIASANKVEDAIKVNQFCSVLMRDGIEGVESLGKDRYKLTRAIARKFLDAASVKAIVYPTAKLEHAGVVNYAFDGGDEYKYLNIIRAEKYNVFKVPELSRVLNHHSLLDEESKCLRLLDVADVSGDDLIWTNS